MVTFTYKIIGLWAALPITIAAEISYQNTSEIVTGFKSESFTSLK